jgi:hypothetical protein
MRGINAADPISASDRARVIVRRMSEGLAGTAPGTALSKNFAGRFGVANGDRNVSEDGHLKYLYGSKYTDSRFDIH